jgi:hypothetical protein
LTSFPKFLLDPIDPFGGPFGGMGGFSHFSSGGGGGGGRMPGVSMRSMNFGGGMDDPFSLMFSQGMGGSAIGQQQQRQRFTGSSAGMGRSESMPVYSSSQPQYDAIPPGTVVSLRALVNAPERNGDRGVIKNYIPSTGRYVCRIKTCFISLCVNLFSPWCCVFHFFQIFGRARGLQ